MYIAKLAIKSRIMKIVLLAVGKTSHSYLVPGIENYIKRIGYYIPFDMLIIPDIKNTKSLSFEQQKDLEGQSIQKMLEPNDYVVLLDEHGKDFTSIKN